MVTSSLTSETMNRWHLEVKGGDHCLSETADTADTARHLLRWWYQSQIRQRIDEADTLRNGVLQDVFALRRHLELINQGPIQGQGNPYEACLEEMEQIYRSLQALSDRLSCPYLEESLPLSLQHLLLPWQAALPLEVKLAGDWEPEPVEQVAVLLTFLEAVLQGVAAEPNTLENLRVWLQLQAEVKAFTVQVGYAQAVPQPLIDLSESVDMTYLLQTFHLLSGGTAQLDRQPQSLSWTLSW